MSYLIRPRRGNRHSFVHSAAAATN